MTDEERTEDLAQLLARLKSEYDVNESEIARRIGVAPATVNAWVNRKRGTGRGPNPEKLRKLAAAFPKFSEAQIFAAAGRKSPGPLSPEDEADLLELFRGLTKEQQDMMKIQARALRDSNQTA
ncbi:helix-turn-helix transcriptional regulator [Streptomyces sp. PSKA54]|uniref:Helix-turn-helix transcriptional regulator n=1 Tax=Streptomyces himalayensis subsp. aureolus TaxID=2758039 RepID=A0A7W2HJC9_9ACTN|nr:helix-turn-helix transcriptional regulator [Streptomyces himalayensis]MBA4865981.1 helix-turn-helix transcriptional regulator [Streptomyces himalayensis subsp. aureolus]